MVKIGTVWDRTVDVLRGRTGILAGIAFVTIFLPAAAGAAVQGMLAAGGTNASSPIAILTSLLLIYGILAITAVATDPHVDTAAAFRIAARRLGAAVGVLVVLVVAAGLFFLPAIVALGLSGATMTAAGKISVAAATPGALVVSGALALLALLAGLWLSARLVPVFAVVVNERRGLGALRRSIAMTRGSTVRLIGVLLLYGILVIVVMLAATSVTGVVARLLLGAGADTAVALVAASVSALVSAATSVVQSVFYAQFYVAARAQEERMAPLS